MSIATRTGDDGTTGLMYNRRVPKSHPQVEACGTVDELNAAIGIARAQAEGEPKLATQLLMIQKALILLMGEIATRKEDLGRYAKDGFKMVDAGMIGSLDELVRELESKNLSMDGWATPGATQLSAALDMARTICRRAERRVQQLVQSDERQNCQAGVYLNRLSDVLWLMARSAE